MTPNAPIPLTPLSPLSPTFYSNQSDNSERERGRARGRWVRACLLNWYSQRTWGRVELLISIRILLYPSPNPVNLAKPLRRPKPRPKIGPTLKPQSMKPEPKSSPSSTPKIVVIGPPPTCSARKSASSPQNCQVEGPLPAADLVIPPALSIPAPRLPSVLVGKCRLEREMMKETLNRN